MTQCNIGIDYSLTSPAMCVHKGKDWSFSNCSFYYFQKKPSADPTDTQFFPNEYPLWSLAQERYNKLANKFLTFVEDGAIIGIEGYAFAGTGRVFNIAENTGHLKFRLWEANRHFSEIPPTVIKKFATGKGNANKDAMYVAFTAEVGFDLRDRIHTKKDSPSSDIVDSYYICKWRFHHDEEGNPVPGATT